MDRKDEIIQRQNDIMQDLLKRQFQSLADDFWGLKSQVESGVPSRPEQTAPENKKAEEKKPEPPKEEKAPEETIEDLKAELHSYIGLDMIKEQVDSLINWINVMKMRREQGLPVVDMSLHMVFTGNPGTGKTMIARLMARIFKALGLLSKGHLTETDRSGLVAGFVGQTAIKTQEVITKALGGVLFIDEAYALTNRGGTDYGQEAVDTLLKAMEDHRDDLIVIVAGYTDLMKEFIESNPGLESRFNRYLHFPDYSLEELIDIFLMRCEKSGYALDEAAGPVLESILKERMKDVEGFGNARGARNLFETAIARQADRLAKEESVTREALMTLTEADLNAAAGIVRKNGEP
ncbi:MAG: AAA family ATPase [Clostridia bacterium]|nr:AAA family ATPase [Clostridia bacterium]